MFSDNMIWGAIPEGFQKLTDPQGNLIRYYFEGPIDERDADLHPLAGTAD